VLEAAIWDTPLDYWIASDLSGLSPDDRSKLTFTRDPIISASRRTGELYKKVLRER
jgi:hypothetical protein